MTPPTRQAPAPDEPHHHTGGEGNVKPPQGGSMAQDATREVMRAAGKINGPGAVLILGLAVLGAAIYFVPPMRYAASSEPLWTQADHVRFEASVDAKIATVTSKIEAMTAQVSTVMNIVAAERVERRDSEVRQDAQMEKLREIASTQATTLARLVGIVDMNTDRIKAMEARQK